MTTHDCLRHHGARSRPPAHGPAEPLPTLIIPPRHAPEQRLTRTVAHELDVDEVYLRPELLDDRDADERQSAVQSEFVGVFPDRASVPRDTWLQLLGGATRHIDGLVYCETFMASVADMLAERAGARFRVRLCWGDPTSTAVDIRDREEGLRGALPHKIRAALTYTAALVDVPGCQVRLHGTTLYASLFRFDDVILANPHMWGAPVSANPLLHLRRLEGSTWVRRDRRSFDAVWDTAQPLGSVDPDLTRTAISRWFGRR